MFKGYREVVIQDVILTPHNTKFLLERYYSPSKEESIDAELPEGYRGSEFGPNLVAFMFMLYFQARVTQNKIEKIANGIGVSITDSEIGRILIKPRPEMEQEQKQIRATALKKADYAQVDHTGARIFDQPAYTAMISNRYFTEYVTGETNDRLSVVQALIGRDEELTYLINRTSLQLLRKRLAKKHFRELERMKSPTLLTQSAFELKLKRLEKLPPNALDEIMTACVIAAYRSREDDRPLALVTDDAKNLKGILSHHQLCWVHEIRHYKLLFAFGTYQEHLVLDQLKQMSEFYQLLKQYKIDPDPKRKKEIEQEFDRIFLRTTPMNALNQELAATYKRKDGLLQVLKDPFLPLETNEAESDARERVLKRKISYGNRSWAGVRAWDLQLGFVHTCRKLKVTYWEFMKDRLMSLGKIPSLHRLIQAAA